MLKRTSKNRLPLTFISGLLLLAFLCFAACDNPSETPVLKTALSPSAKPSLAPLAANIPDIAGCWRPANSDGSLSGGTTFEFRRVADNAFVFASDNPPRTKLVFQPDGHFQELNYDDEKPFFPKGYSHSQGILKSGGNLLERKIQSVDQPQLFRRCSSVNAATPVLKPTPRPIVVPTVPPDSPSPSPIILSSSSPSPAAEL